MSERMSRLELFQKIPFFEGLADDELRALLPVVIERGFRAGEIIVNQGEPGSSMYVIAEGHVTIYLPGEASRRVSLKDLSRGEYFGEMALFDEKPRSASALAATDVTLLELRREVFTDYLAYTPRAAMPILRTLAERLRETNALLSQRVAKNAVQEFEMGLRWRERLADRIAELNGSWSFLLGLLLLSGFWFVLNSHLVFFKPFDEYPYVFFNLLLALIVALQGPLIMMSQNRQSLKDRAQAEADFKINLKNELNIETVVRELGEFRAEANDRLKALESQTLN